MNTLEPLCNFEQSKMLKELGFMEATLNYYNLRDEPCTSSIGKANFNNGNTGLVSRPTISLAKNWLYDKYGIWIETHKLLEEPPYCFESGIQEEGIFIAITDNHTPHTAESDCLTEVLKKLTNEKSNS